MPRANHHWVNAEPVACQRRTFRRVLSVRDDTRGCDKSTEPLPYFASKGAELPLKDAEFGESAKIAFVGGNQEDARAPGAHSDQSVIG